MEQILYFDAAGSDVWATGNAVIESRATAEVTFDTSTAGQIPN